MEQFLITLASQYQIPFQLGQWAFFFFVLWHFFKYIFKAYDYLSDAHKIKKNYDAVTQKTLVQISDVRSDLDGIRTKMGIVRSDMKSMRQDLSDLKSAVGSLAITLGEGRAFGDARTFSKNSPVSLTQEGLALVEKSGFAHSLEIHEQEVFDHIDKQAFTSKHDLEHFCISVMHRYNGSPEKSVFTPVKEYLYENGEVEELKVITACAIYLRDAYLLQREAQFTTHQTETLEL